MLLLVVLLSLPQQRAPRSEAARLTSQIPAAAESSTVGIRVLRGASVVGPPRLGGRLDEPAWANAAVATAFTESYPGNGVAPSRRTEARLVFVGDALYVGIRAFDSPDSIVAPLMRRDSRDNTDMLQVLIDSFHDRRTAFEFGVTPAGVKFDGYHYDDVQVDDSWDAVWDVVVARDSLGWTAEFRIPLSQLRYSVSSERPGTWGINFYRNISPRQEWSSWARVRIAEHREVSQLGEVNDVGV